LIELVDRSGDSAVSEDLPEAEEENQGDE
jgi:hypothetical protein